jgi:hypothetical protein
MEWHVETERVNGLKVDELELGWMLHGQIDGFGAPYARRLCKGRTRCEYPGFNEDFTAQSPHSAMEPISYPIPRNTRLTRQASYAMPEPANEEGLPRG